MKLVRFGAPGREQPGIWIEERHAILPVRDRAFDIHDFNPGFFARRGMDRLLGLLAEEAWSLIPATDMRLGPPIAAPGKIICVGKNYTAHALEVGTEPPGDPVLFAKAPSSLAGPYDPIPISGEGVFDSEAELAVVIGRLTRGVSEQETPSHIAGYMTLNDVTEREAQRARGQWFYAKNWDGFCPVGPFLVSTDEIETGRNLRIFSRLDGALLQEGHSADMIFPVASLISHISARITLYPGDVIATGTPAGIGSLHDPPRILRPGSVIEVGVDACGTQRCSIVEKR